MINSAPKLRLTALKKYPDRRQDLVRLGPFRGVLDNGDAGEQSPEFLQDAVNGFFEHAKAGGDVFARPGFQRITASILESGGGNAAQGLFGITIAGSYYLFVFVNGKVYRHTSATGWTDVSPGGVTISTTANRIYAILYNGEMIVNDGVNEPWRGTGLTASPITGTEIEINTAGAAWVARGKPTVHGGKLFMLVESIASTSYFARFVWSEENAAATGYLQDTYTNSWDFIQAPAQDEKIWAIQGSNVGLVLLRTQSIATVYGAVSTTFVTDSTHDGITSTGIHRPGVSGSAPEVCLAEGFVWFVNNAGQPCRFRVGSGTIEPLWEQLRTRLHKQRTLDSNSVSVLAVPSIAYASDLGKVGFLFLPSTANNTLMSADLYIFDAESGNYEGRWNVARTTQGGTGEGLTFVTAAARDENMTHKGASTFAVTTEVAGTHVWHQTTLEMTGSSTVSFGDNAGAMHQSITPMLNPDEMVTEFNVDEMHVEAFPDSATMSYDHYTPRGSTLAGSMVGITGSDSIQASHDHGIYRAALLAMGRWFRPVLYWNVPSGSTPYGFERAVLKVRGVKASGVSK